MNDTQVGTDRIVDLPAGGSATATVPWDTTHLRGDQVITVIVDATQVVPERDESDNSASKIVTIRGNRLR